MKAKRKKEVRAAPKETLIDSYEFLSDKIPVTINIFRTPNEFVPLYSISISSISGNTEIILERIRKELIKQVNLGMVGLTDQGMQGLAEERFKETIVTLIKKYFPDADEKTMEFLSSYLIQKGLGMGNVEIRDDDPMLEEICINTFY